MQQILWITNLDNLLATSLLTTCNRLFVNKLSQAIRTHSDTGLLITICYKMSTDLLQIVRFLLCNGRNYIFVTFSYQYYIKNRLHVFLNSLFFLILIIQDDVGGWVICISNKVEYVDKEGSYKNSTKEVVLSF